MCEPQLRGPERGIPSLVTSTEPPTTGHTLLLYPLRLELKAWCGSKANRTWGQSVGNVEKKADGHLDSDPVHTSSSSSFWVVLAPNAIDAQACFSEGFPRSLNRKSDRNGNACCKSSSRSLLRTGSRCRPLSLANSIPCWLSCSKWLCRKAYWAKLCQFPVGTEAFWAPIEF